MLPLHTPVALAGQVKIPLRCTKISSEMDVLQNQFLRCLGLSSNHACTSSSILPGMLAQDAQFLLAAKERKSGKQLNRNKVSPRSKLQQLLDRHLSNSGCNVSGDPKVKRWHEPETGGRRCHRLLAGRVLMFNPELVGVLCEKISSETDPQKLREMNLLLQAVIKEDTEEVRIGLASLAKKWEWALLSARPTSSRTAKARSRRLGRLHHGPLAPMSCASSIAT